MFSSSHAHTDVHQVLRNADGASFSVLLAAVCSTGCMVYYTTVFECWHHSTPGELAVLLPGRF